MTREEAIIYFKQCNSKIISVCKDENEYDYEKQEIISDCARKTYEVNRLALEALEQESKTDDENELKFYYVESTDDYWIGQRVGNFYYANWDEDVGFVWSHSRYLPWGEHIVNENSLWKEHTYPSEPVEIPFTEWIVGFMKKYSTEPKIGCEKNHKKANWKMHTVDNGYNTDWKCTNCGFTMHTDFFGYRYCPKCGTEMESD